ncbi:MAG: hypothetical protein AB7F25_07040 [Deferribacterales bacterium]
MTFADEIKRAFQRQKEAIEEVMINSVKETSEMVILRDPVDTGKNRANMQAMLNGEPTSSVNWQGDDNGLPEGGSLLLQSMLGRQYEAPMPSPASDFAISRMIPVAEQAPGNVFVLANPVTYTEDLELYGKSPQAPQGMFRLSAAEWQNTVKENVNKVK